MDKYLKMSGHFVGNVSINADGQICDDKYFRGSTDIAEDYYAPICHAINSHDELVAEVERLRDMVISMQTYLDMAGEHPEKESDNPVRQWLFDAIDCTK